MIDSPGKRIKRYVDHMKDKLKLTCPIHGPGRLSYLCKVLGDFDTKYDNYKITM